MFESISLFSISFSGEARFVVQRVHGNVQQDPRQISRHSNMNQGNLTCFFLMLFCIGMSIQVPIDSKGHSEKYLKSSEVEERVQTSLKPRIPTVGPTKKNEHFSTDEFELCGITASPRKMARCNDENPLPLCLNEFTGNVTMCRDVLLPLRKSLCVKHFLNLQHVVSCTDTTFHVCYASDAKGEKLEFCKRPAGAVCLEMRTSEFHTCSAGRIRRQDVQEPELDMDGYYLKCEDCDLKVVMKVDEENKEQPVIEISSQPRKKSNEPESSTTKKPPTTKA